MEKADKEIIDLKKQKLEEEYTDDGFMVGSSKKVSEKELSKLNEEGSSLNIGSFKRETLENGQRMGVLVVDKEMIKGLTVDEKGDVTISLRSSRFRGDDFLNQEIKINLKEFEKLNPDDNGMVSLMVFEKNAGGSLEEKKELSVMKDTQNNRQSLIDQNKEVLYVGEEKFKEREKIMNTPITQNIIFRDVYNRMNEKDKAEIGKKENSDLEKFISHNKKPMSEIEENIISKEFNEKKKEGKKLYLNKEDGTRVKVVCAGLDGNGKVIYKEDGGKTHQLNPYVISEKIELSKTEKNKIVSVSFKEKLDEMGALKQKGIKI